MKHKTAYFDMEEVDAMLEYCDDHDRIRDYMLVMTLIRTARRISEVVGEKPFTRCVGLRPCDIHGDGLIEWDILKKDHIKTKTKAELYEEAVKRGIMLAPCNNMVDIMKNAQLDVRGFWVKVDHPELNRKIVYPGAPVKMEQTPWKVSRRAPLIGEHNREIYEKEMGLSVDEMAKLKKTGVI